MSTADHRLEIIKTLCDIAVNASDACFENDAGSVECGVLDHVDKLNLGKFDQDRGNPPTKMRVKAGRYAQFRDVLPPHLLYRGLYQGFSAGDIVEAIDKLAHAINDKTGKISLYFEQALIQFAVLIEELPDGLDARLDKAILIATPRFILIGRFCLLKNLGASCFGLGKKSGRFFHRREFGPPHDMRAGSEFELQLA